MKKILVFVLSLAVLFFWGCRDQVMVEGEAAVRAYTGALTIAYRTNNPEVVRAQTTEKEWSKVYTLIDLKRADSLALESTLEELVVTSAEKTSEQVMIVGTTERWRYFDRPLNLGRPQGQEFVVEMDLTYSFVLKEEVWKMDQAHTLRHTYLQPVGYQHDQHQEHGEHQHEEAE